MIDLSNYNLFQQVLMYLRLPNSYYLNMFSSVVLMILCGAMLYQSLLSAVNESIWLAVIELLLALTIGLFGVMAFSSSMRKYNQYIALVLAGRKSELEIKFK